MQRLYFLTPDEAITSDIAYELNELGLRQQEVHVIANDRDRLRDLGLNKATLIQTSDAINAGKRGLIIGIPLGLVIGIIAASVLSLPSQLGNVALIAGMGIFGGLFGIWASTLIGVSVRDVKYDKYKPDIERGNFLMLVDVSSEREEEIITIIHRHHPQVKIDKVTGEERRHAGGEGS